MANPIMAFHGVHAHPRLFRPPPGSRSFESIIGHSAALGHVLHQVEMVAPTAATVLIIGETGTGKELIARAIHELSPRAGGTFVGLNCVAIPAGLLESELFGHERGAFTGATAQRIGRFELATNGTMFLDEAGDIPIELQSKLLRVLQEREFERLGSARVIRSDARLVAATNRDLGRAVERQEFRADLYYRLAVFPIRLPSLRERPEDIPVLVRHFTQQFALRMGRQIETIPSQTMEALSRYSWPGNIRELQNMIERAVILSDGSELSVDLRWLSPGPAVTRSITAVLPAAPNGKTFVDQERSFIESALEEAMGRVSGPFGAATKLGMPPSTLESKIKVLKIEKSRFKSIPPSRNHEVPSRGFREAS